jgi:hypothetical protein
VNSDFAALLAKSMPANGRPISVDELAAEMKPVLIGIKLYAEICASTTDVVALIDQLLARMPGDE